MRLSDLIAKNQLIEVRCRECRAQTPLDPSLFLVRRGDVDLQSLRPQLYCTQCGSADIDLVAPTREQA